MSELIKLPRWLRAVVPFVGERDPVVAHLELRGVITEGGLAGKGVSHAKVRRAIETAFANKRTAAVAVTINSPGGSPVQSRLIFRTIRREAEKAEKPVFTFIEDVGASGGYILALAGDEIYADESSIVGSIGVIAAGFGFQEAIARFGVERRIHTAGENKSQLDPFRPEAPEDVERLERVLDDLHGQFIALVRSRRGDRLEEGDDLFSGAFWTAGEAARRGLIDGTAHLADFVRDRFGKDARIRTVPVDRGSLLKRLLGGVEADAEAMLSAVEARTWWARYGL